MAETILRARRLLTDAGVVDFPVVTIDGAGMIAAIDSDPGMKGAGEDTLTAAFLDVHIHGASGHDVMAASPAGFAEMQAFLAAHGVAHYLPTTVTADVETTLRALAAMADAIERAPAAGQARPVGIHLEGPFLSHAKRAVHPAAALQRPSVALFERFREAARGHLALMTIAPELDGATELIAHAVGCGVRSSLGHTNALAAEARAGIDAGAVSATHTFNAMRSLDHREPGVLGVVLDDARLFAELICDGVHVSPEIVRLWWKAKGRERAVLVTDAMSAAGMPDGEYGLGGLRVTVTKGRALLSEDLAAGKETLAGSVLTMDRAVENFARFTRVDAGEAAQLAARTPAALLGRPELTSVRVGAVANLNRLDARGRLLETYVRDERVPGR